MLSSEVLVPEARQFEHFVPSHCLRVKRRNSKVKALKKLRMPEIVSDADCHEHTAGEVPHLNFFQSCQKANWCGMICERPFQQHQVDDRWHSALSESPLGVG